MWCGIANNLKLAMGPHSIKEFKTIFHRTDCQLLTQIMIPYKR